MSVMLSAAGSLRWFRDALAPGEAFGDLVGGGRRASRPGATGCCSSPTSPASAARTRIRSPAGAFVGLTLGHDRRHLTRAVLEGVAFGLRDGLDLMVAAGMPAPDQIRASGGGTASPVWRQILADVLERRDRDRQHDRGRRLRRRRSSRRSAPAGSRPWTRRRTRCVRRRPSPSPGPDAPRVRASAHAAYRELYPALAPIVPRSRTDAAARRRRRLAAELELALAAPSR